MKMLHFEGYFEQDEIVTTPSFLDLNLKFSYALSLSKSVNMKLETGVHNIFNSYQSDFDRGMFRDAGYMYGPLKTRSIYFGLKFGS